MVGLVSGYGSGEGMQRAEGRGKKEERLPIVDSQACPRVREGDSHAGRKDIGKEDEDEDENEDGGRGCSPQHHDVRQGLTGGSGGGGGPPGVG